MNKRILLSIFAMCCVYSIAETTQYTDDYCWRDYNGIMPPDALPVNRPNKHQKSMYIGQTLFSDKIIVGKLYENDNNIYVEYFNVEYAQSGNVKILCSQHPNKFEWIPTRNADVRKLTDTTLIEGGFEPNCSTYIGRVMTNEGLTPGKVMCCTETDCYGLYTTNNGTGTLHSEFQILTYSKSRASPKNIDVRSGNAGPINGKCRKITINLFN